MTSRSTLIGLTFICGALLLAWVLDKALASSFAQFGVRNAAVLGDQFTLSTLIGVVVAAAAGAFGFTYKTSKTFVGEVIDEVSKVSWPEWSETKVNTVVVIVFSFISAGILGVFDAVFSYLTDNNLFLY